MQSTISAVRSALASRNLTTDQLAALIIEGARQCRGRLPSESELIVRVALFGELERVAGGEKCDEILDLIGA